MPKSPHRILEIWPPMESIPSFTRNLWMRPCSWENPQFKAKSINYCLNTFLVSSFLDINKYKSHICFFNTCHITKRNIYHILGFSKGTLPSKYLGAPLLDSLLKYVSWKDLLDCLNLRLSSWTYHSLNLPNHLTLLKLILQTLALYLFSILAAPKSILKKIKSLQRNFLWEARWNKINGP